MTLPKAFASISPSSPAVFLLNGSQVMDMTKEDTYRCKSSTDTAHLQDAISVESPTKPNHQETRSTAFQKKNTPCLPRQPWILLRWPEDTNSKCRQFLFNTKLKGFVPLTPKTKASYLSWICSIDFSIPKSNCKSTIS